MRKKKSLLFSLLTMLVIAGALILYLFLQPGSPVSTGISPAASASTLPEFTGGSGPEFLRVIYLDVGQGDSALILTPDGKAMLIDAGESTAQKKIAKVLEEYGVSTLDMLVATHPHSDHIGGMQYIVENFEVRQICMPNVSHTSQTYESLLMAVQEKGIPALEARAGKSFELGSLVHCEILAPAGTSYDNLNDSSAVLRLSYEETSFLFTGDAEFPSEAEMLENNPDALAADVLKIGHHGSRTSSAGEFLDAVHPSYAIISCGLHNSYGHPHTETLEALAGRAITVYRTDELGDILAYSDGATIEFAKAGALPIPASEKVQSVYVTSGGKSYHRKSCQYYRKDSVQFTIKEAKNLGYRACTKCFKN